MTRTQERGFTLIELLIVVGLLGVLLAIAVPGLLRARQAGSEASAIGSLRTISSAQYMYAAACASGYFAPGLLSLGTAPPTGPAFISPDIGYADIVVKSGFTFTIRTTTGASPASPASCNGVAAGASLGGYNAVATPAVGMGTKAFGVNPLGTIYWAAQMVPLAMTDTSAPDGARPIPE
jgi:prepilin-type N-terminal cleavage/methylation domain-containing protein